ncbi:PREDICTED: ribonuclease HI-like [Fragaria vesca subsp. vesca]
MTRKKSCEGIILETPDGSKHEYTLEFQFNTSNNAAEYEALIGGLQLTQDIGVKRVEVFSDSQLVVNQVNESFEAKEPQLNSYQALSKAFMQRFKSASISHILRKKNSNIDALARLAIG